MLLLIPGPVSTRPAVRAAMTTDIAPWDNSFRDFITRLRARLLPIAGVTDTTHAALPLQGCGHFITEAAIRTFLPPGGKLLIPASGAYADRMIRLAQEAGRIPIPLPINPDLPTPPDQVAAALAADPTISHVGLVYSETGTGVVHNPATIGAAIRAAGRHMLLDAVSAFGALPLNLAAQPEIDAVVFTSNKCLEALPGMGFAIVRKDRTEAAAGQAGSWSFDLADILAHTTSSGPGSFRFTPPAQILAALAVALDLFDAEGGQPARLARYQANAQTLHTGLSAIGLTPWLPLANQGPIVMNIHSPNDPNWNLQHFVDLLKTNGVLISNFHNTPTPSFRLGCIGALTPHDMTYTTTTIDRALSRMRIQNRAGGVGG